MKTLEPRMYDCGVLSVVALPLGLTSVGQAAEGLWTQKADMPTARMLLGTCVVEGRIYAIGGAPAPHAGLSAVEEYNPRTDTWTTRTAMPTPRCGMGVSAVNGKIYAIGGLPLGARTVEEYDPGTDTWKRKADMPTGRGFFTASVVNGKIYAVGGATDTSGPAFRTVEEYDPATDAWATQPDMPTPRGALSTAALDSRIYVMGGTVTLHSDVLSTVEEYTPNPLVVGFNGDGMVDIQDLLQLIESWGQADPNVDIAPRPTGDGVIDEKDLELLMSHWGEEPGLVAQWKLDEVSGTTATDSVGANDGTLVGNPSWQPAGGKVDGALQFDGGMRFVMTAFVCDPAAGPFSVFAWVKGGGPEQVILSQENGANWLAAAAPDGVLATELKCSGRAGTNMKSSVRITDGAWHRVGLVWDGSNRTLYVDDAEVATDAQSNLTASAGGLYIGAGATLAPASFWSGLVDEVRVYNRVVKP